ncbi:HEAT repeat domain-containing protein [Candidatus Omnitrophota bacterium]
MWKTKKIILISVLIGAIVIGGVVHYQDRLKYLDGEYLIKNAKAEWMMKKPQAAIKYLITALKNQDRFVRQAAVEMLAEIEDPRTVKILINVLNDKQPKVRKAAVLALGKKGDPAVVDALMRALADENREIRRAAADLLIWMHHGAVNTVMSVIKDGDDIIRRHASLAFVDIRDPRAVVPLIDALKDENENVRKEAATVLSLEHKTDPRVIKPLLVALEDENEEVSKLAYSALRSRGRDLRPIESLREAPKYKKPKEVIEFAGALDVTSDPE